MTAPSVEFSLLAPVLIVLGVAVAGVIVEAFLPRRARYATQVSLSLTGLLAAFGALVDVYRQTTTGRTAAVGAVVIDRPGLYLQGAILLVAVFSVLLIGERRGGFDTGAAGLDAFTAQASTVPGSLAEKVATQARITQTEVFPLTMFSVGGMMLFTASGDLLTMFIALEVLSLPLYLMCGLARFRRLQSQEASLKYFLLGAFSSAFFLYGMALLYGYAGTLSLTGIAEALRTGPDNTTLALIGTALVVVALLFKVGAVPFHSWVPDVYQGAPTAITGFMAAATKIAAFGALMRVLYVAVPALKDDWRPVLWAVAILTMAVGTIAAVTQADVKRMLGVFGCGAYRFHPRRCDRRQPGRGGRHVVLPGGLRFQHGGGFRRCQCGARQRRRGADRPGPLGRPGPPPSTDRFGVRTVPAGLRRHTADRRFRR